MVKTYELQHGLIYIYYDGHLTQIVADSPQLRGDLVAKGYTQHNKFEREGKVK